MTTRTRISLVAAALAAAALVAATTRLHAATGRVLRLDVTATRISGVDVPPLITGNSSPETPGDEVIAVSRVGGSATGKRYLVCTVVERAPSIETALYACQVTYTLARGTITAAGVVHLNGSVAAAITGGTGAYAGARGLLASAPGHDTLTLQ